MAQSKIPSTFTDEDIMEMRLRKILDSIGRKYLLVILRQCTPSWENLKGMSFNDHLKSIGRYTVSQLNKVIKTPQRDVMKSDPTGETFDVTLLFLLILWGNEILEDKDHDVWKKKSKQLEYLITAVKNARNTLAHNSVSKDHKAYLDQIEEIRRLLKDMMIEAKSRIGQISQSELDIMLQDIDQQIDHIRDDPLECHETEFYKLELILDQKKDHVRKKSRENLEKLFRYHSTINPSSHLVQTSFPLEEVFANLKICDECYDQLKSSPKNPLANGNGQMEVELRNILEVDGNSQCNFIILEGEAGAGKSTCLKRILTNWSQQKWDIQGLDTYEIVLYFEFKDHIRSFDDLLSRSMPDAIIGLTDHDRKQVLFGLKMLIITDGFDESNCDSSVLFQEILQLGKYYDFTVLTTSRPEAIEKLTKLIDSRDYQRKHFKLIGLDKTSQISLVTKYFKCITDTSGSLEDLNGLLKFIKDKENIFAGILQLPYNLCSLTILWLFRPDEVNSITTVSELHWQMYKLHESKLKERLFNRQECQHLPNSVINKKIKEFILCLSQVSLAVIGRSEVTLSTEDYEVIEETCHEQDLPCEVFIGAFLKTSHTSSGTRYSFPHKGVLDFFGAYGILLQLTKISAKKERADLGTKASITSSPGATVNQIKRRTFFQRLFSKCKEFKSTVWKEKPSVIRDMIERYSDSSSPLDLSRYQNLLKCLIGMFFNKKNQITENQRQEALELLQESGVTSRDDWMSALTDIKCDPGAADYICKQKGILNGEVTIRDKDLLAYLSLLRSLVPPVTDAENIHIELKVMDNMPEIKQLVIRAMELQLKLETVWIYDANAKLFEEILNDQNHDVNTCIENVALDQSKRMKMDLCSLWKSMRKINVNMIYLNGYFRHPTSSSSNEIDVLEDIINKCQLQEYIGPMLASFSNEKEESLRRIKELHVTVLSDQEEDFNKLNQRIQQRQLPQLQFFAVSVNKGVDVKKLSPLSGDLKFPPVLFLPDITSAEDVIQIVSTLKPIKGKHQKFVYILFPRLSVDLIGEMLTRMKEEGIQVERSIVLPSSSPSSPSFSPSSVSVPTELQKHIQWRKPDMAPEGSILDLDSW